MKITYWSDFACPYCYIGNTRLKKVIRELGVEDKIEFDIHAFELDSNAPSDVQSTTVERFAMKYGLSLEESQKEVDNISKLGIDEGIDFKYSSTLYTNTRDAHRLMKLAQSRDDPELVDRLSTLLFDAYFTKNLKLADKNVLRSICLDAGLEKDEVEEVLNSDLYNSEVEEDEKIAFTTGISGVPFYLIDGKYSVPGALSSDGFKDMLIQVLGEIEEIESEDGVTCKDGFCKL
ncbi:MAG: DsbA family oxidoreductase [Methanosphaera sp.]|nr:DsbA family oxidoreductase [Methanosphaera sp.]